MGFIPAQVTVEASLCVFRCELIYISVDRTDGLLRFILRKPETKSLLVIHYNRISYLHLSNVVLSLYLFSLTMISSFLIIKFHVKNDTEVKLTFRFPVNSGREIAYQLYEFFRSINPVTSCIIICSVSYRLCSSQYDGESLCVLNLNPIS